MLEHIRDASGRIIGTIYEVGSKLHIREFTGKDVAIYDKYNDTTWDLKNNRIVKGNQLIMFLR